MLVSVETTDSEGGATAPVAAEATDGGDTERLTTVRGDADPLERYADRWYRPDSQTYDYAVRTPEGGRRYLKTKDGAVRALERYYD